MIHGTHWLWSEDFFKLVENIQQISADALKHLAVKSEYS